MACLFFLYNTLNNFCFNNYFARFGQFVDSLKSAFFAYFLYLYTFELYTKLTTRRTRIRHRARQNAEKSAFYLVSCILHLNSFSSKRGRCLTQHPLFNYTYLTVSEIGLRILSCLSADCASPSA